MPRRKSKTTHSSIEPKQPAAAEIGQGTPRVQNEPLDSALAQVDDAMQRLAQAHREFASARDEVAHQHRLTLLGTMVGAIAHEINNVLTPALSYAQLALSRPEDAALAKKALERAASGATMVSKITGTILDFAKDRRFHVEQGGHQRRECDVEQVVHEALGSLVRDPAKDGIRVELDVPAGLIAAIDGVLLHQVLVNLMCNAVRAMRGKGGRMVVQGGMQDGLIWLEVTDTGPGVPKEIASRLFTGIVSGGAHVPRGTGGGHGLGLMISRMLVESDGGTLELVPHNAGARFRITLPTND
jgi:signal transduction histidine kinase